MGKKPSIQAIHRKRRIDYFVGREEETASFRSNIELPYEGRKYIWNIYGQGGIGKTSLVKRFNITAEEYGAITAITDESQSSILYVMATVARQLSEQGVPLTEFSERHKTFRQLKEQVESDPNLPTGLSSMVGHAIGKTGVAIARQAPLAGLVVDFLGEENVVEKFGQYAAFVVQKIKNRDEIQLVLEPIEVLTPLFLSGLAKITEKRRLVLTFDTYEQTSKYLDTWLRNIIEGWYGELDPDVLLIIAGREKLSSDWSDYMSLVHIIHLSPLTEEEAQEFLSARGIEDSDVIDLIIQLSGRIPLWLATLASQSPKHSDELGDPTDEAIERFLKWIDHDEKRQAAILFALPQRLDKDVISIIVGKENAPQLFEWLKTQPFVQQKAGEGWVYHEVVRPIMLRHLIRESHDDWGKFNHNLSEYYLSRRDALKLDTDMGVKHDKWTKFDLAYLYHRLCVDSDSAVTFLLEGYISAFDRKPDYARLWGEIAQNVGYLLIDFR